MSPKKSSKKSAKAKPLKAKLSSRKAKPKPAPAKAARRIAIKSAIRTPAKTARKKGSVKERLKAVKKLIPPSRAPRREIPIERVVGRAEPRPEYGHELTTRRILEKLRESGIVDEEKPEEAAEKKPVVKPKKLRLITAIVPKKPAAPKEEGPSETKEVTPAEVLPQKKEEAKEEPKEEPKSSLSAEEQEERRLKKLIDSLEAQEKGGQEIPEEEKSEEEIKAVLEAAPADGSKDSASEGEEETEEETPKKEEFEKEEDKEPVVPFVEETAEEEKPAEPETEPEAVASGIEKKKKEVPFEWGPSGELQEEPSEAHVVEASTEEKKLIDSPRLLKSLAGSVLVSLTVAFALGAFGLSLATVLLGAGAVFLSSTAYFYLLLKHA